MRQAGFCGDAAPRSAARLAALLARVVGGLLRVVTGPGSACGLSAGLARVSRPAESFLYSGFSGICPAEGLGDRGRPRASQEPPKKPEAMTPY